MNEKKLKRLCLHFNRSFAAEMSGVFMISIMPTGLSGTASAVTAAFHGQTISFGEATAKMVVSGTK